jgi:hypothetical protein
VDDDPERVWKRAERAVITADVPALEALLRDHEQLLRAGPPQRSWFDGLPPHFSGDDVRAIIASSHHFDSWQEFAAFARALADEKSAVAQFEAAVDAVINGDEATLDRLLRAHPELVHARSVRPHHATLLNYVGANGVEGFRQKTPKNAVRIAELLLEAGAEVDAVGDMYRGTTTLGLVATSVHPVETGVQADLIDLLVNAGASLARAVAPDYTEGRVVNACLANGRGEGAQLVAAHGAELDLEGAAGIGCLDVVKSFFDEDGRLKPGATRDQMRAGLFWACQYGHRDVVEFLLGRGVDLAEPHRGETMLHAAALGGHPEIVRILLAHGAPLDVEDENYHGTPLAWALYGWANRSTNVPPDGYYDIVDLLVAAGASVRDEWRASTGISRDSRLIAALMRGARGRQ